MTLAQLIAQFRREADDAVAPYFFSDSAVTDWLNEAVDEACVRSLLIKDWSTSAVCNIAITAGTSTYSTHASIINITRAEFFATGDAETDGDVLGQVTEHYLDAREAGWRTRTERPVFYVHHDTKLRLGCLPETDGTLKLEVNRLPLAPMALTTDSPEFAAKHHRHLVAWALHRAFSIPDTEVIDPARSARSEAEFTRMFGLRMDATIRRDDETDVPHHNRAVWL